MIIRFLKKNDLKNVFVYHIKCNSCSYSEQYPMIIIFHHATNLFKLGLDGKPIYNEKGKVMKGPNYFKPDLGKFVA